MSDRPNEILAVNKVSMCLKVGKRTICRLALRGKMPAFSLGDTRIFCRAEADKWSASLTYNVVAANAKGGEE